MARDTGSENIHVEIDHPRMTIEGYLMNNMETDGENREKFIFFLGVPYAKPPLGDLRFQPPQPYVYDPVKDGNPFKAVGSHKVATQFIPKSSGSGVEKLEKIRRQSTGKGCISTEDCLNLHIYVPKRPKEIIEPLAVLVYFHGGGLFQGTGNYSERTPESMMKQNILLVMVNYRLGPFGFLNMHTKKCRGNAGLKDQVMALHWIQNNIRNFGGDPNNVTISGESAGGSCVNCHLVSPLSKGLFHKAIVQSGGIYCPWGYTGDQRRVMKNYKRYSSLLEGRQFFVLRKLMKAKVENILRFDLEINFESRPAGSSDIHIGPSIESNKPGAFIPYGIEKLIKEANPVPILAGITALDGYSIFAKGNSLEIIEEWILNEKNFCEFLGANLHWEGEEVEKYYLEIREKYFDMDEIRKLFETEEDRESQLNESCSFETEEDRESQTDDSCSFQTEAEEAAWDDLLLQAEERMARFCTDLWFHRFYDNFKLGGDLKKEAPLYVYEFDLVSDLNMSKDYRRKLTRAAHCDDLVYLFCSVSDRQELMPFNEDIQKKITTMCSLWASFCKTGVPKSAFHDEEWLPHTEEEPKYLYIGEDLEMKNGRLNESRWDYLNAIVQEVEQIRAQKSQSCSQNITLSLKLKWEEVKRFFIEASSKCVSSSSVEGEAPCPETSNPSEHLEGTKESECSQPSTSCPRTSDFSKHSKGSEESNVVRLEVPTTESSKRHSPSKSPTSQSKTSKDEASQAKKERT